MFYRSVLRPLLYALSAETAHRLVMGTLALVQRIRPLLWLADKLIAYRDPTLRVHAFGRTFDNPIGLAAGLDKEAHAYEALAALGFGFVEVGTLTAQPQPGNPKPRLFRLVRDRALINRMGFNNCGAQDAAQRLSERASQHGERSALLGINIGKTKVVAAEDAIGDYAISAELLSPLADYLVVNVSSPNTPGLRDLQAVASLRPLLTRMREVIERACPIERLPLLLKIAPDLSDEDIDAIADLALELGIDGIIATNTTIARTGLASDPREVEACGAGGLSGAPLKARSLDVLRRLRARVGDRVTLVAAGGIETVDDAWDRICAGATLVQIYTALIYEGPTLPSRLARGIARKVRETGRVSVADAIGCEAPETR
jgi:dihydroorotate dehydrogenase